MDKYKRSQESKEVREYKCWAYGCPIPPAINDKSCRYHHGIDARDADPITQKLRQAETMRKRIQDLKDDPWNKNLYEYISKPEWSKPEDMEVFPYIAMLERAVYTWVRGDSTLEQAVEKEKSQNAGEIAKSVTQFTE